MSSATKLCSPAPEPWGINPFTRKARNYPTQTSKRKGLGLNSLTLKPRPKIRPAELEGSFIHPRCTQPLEVPTVSLLASSPVFALKTTARTPLPTYVVPPQVASLTPQAQQHTKALPVKYAGTAFDTSIPSRASLVSTPRPQQWGTDSAVRFAGTAFDTSIPPKPSSFPTRNQGSKRKATSVLPQNHVLSIPQSAYTSAHAQGALTTSKGAPTLSMNSVSLLSAPSSDLLAPAPIVQAPSQRFPASSKGAVYAPVQDFAGLLSTKKRYAKVLGSIDNPFVHFLRRKYGLPSFNASSVIEPPVTTSNIEGSTSNEGNANQPTFFQDDWETGIGYRYRPTRFADVNPTTDKTIQEVLSQAENWVVQLYSAFMNTENVSNKPNSHDLKYISGPTLDRKEVEATCRLILTSLIHRCVVGFTGTSRKTDTRQTEYQLNCHDRLLAVIAGLHKDKRICKDMLYEDAKIVAFVHQPISFLKQKEVQETNNAKKSSLTTAKNLGGQDEVSASVHSSVQNTPASRQFARTARSTSLANSPAIQVTPAPVLPFSAPITFGPVQPSSTHYSGTFAQQSTKESMATLAIGNFHPTDLIQSPAMNIPYLMITSRQRPRNRPGAVVAKPARKTPKSQSPVATPTSHTLQPYCTPMVFAMASASTAQKIALTKKRAYAVPVSKESRKRGRSSDEEGSTAESLSTSPHNVVDGDTVQVEPVAETVAASTTPSSSSAAFREPSLESDDLVSRPSKKRRRH